MTKSVPIRLRAATREILVDAMQRFGVLHQTGSGDWRAARGVTISWLGQFKIGADTFDPVTGDIIAQADTDQRYHVDLLIAGSALGAEFRDRISGESANASALEVLLLIWGRNGVAVDTNVGAETSLLYLGVELLSVRSPKHGWAGVSEGASE